MSIKRILPPVGHLMLLTGALAVSLMAPLAQSEPAIPLFDNLGTLHHPITTNSERAQAYFDQGLRLVYAFNHEEAINSFEEAARLDPSAAMAHWGIALALGPNINASMDRPQERRAYDAIQKALARSAQVTPHEQAYIQALAKRYSIRKGAKRAILDQAYADAMRQVASQFPEDADAATLYAEALMDLRPWDLWTADGRPQPGTDDLVATLEKVLQQTPDHPGACHYYIHAVEASSQPERVLDCAKRLPDLMPGAGHLVHMPAHVYMRVGRYREASERNAQASHVDHEYLSHRTLTGGYPSGYSAHNVHFLWATLTMEGRSVDALQAARKLVSMLSLADVQKDPVLEQNMPTPYLALVRFGRWGELLREAPPPKTLRFTMGMWHYARGLTLTATQRFSGAEAELAQVALSERSLPKGNRTDLKTARALLKIAERVLAGELAAKRARAGEAIQSLKDAVLLEDRLPYAEPPYWDHPVRQRLGAVLLAADRAAEAEAVYREDLKRHPENGWSLYGLLQSLRAQQKTDEATAVESRFEQAWSRADVSLTGSSF